MKPLTVIRYDGGSAGWKMALRFAAKRVLDIAGSLAGFILLSPLMLLIAALVTRTSNGPALYSQMRVGRNGKPFRIYKFRSMVADAEKSGATWCKGPTDGRITPLGGFLRRVHLDELPQLWNVLRGEMSLVGPRPERPEFAERFEQNLPGYTQRHGVRPGITGLAQVHYRYDASLKDVKQKLRYDRLYVRRVCPALDLWILWRTFAVALLQTGW